jgi:hypothetical protein
MIIGDGGKIEGFKPLSMPESLNYPLNAELLSPDIESKSVLISKNPVHPEQWVLLIPVINYDEFTLPFLPVENEEDSEDCEEVEYSKYDHLEELQALIPADVIFLGELNNEIPHSPGLTWDIEDYYYLMKWKDADYDWALFRITWDDNWGRYEWSTGARIKGVQDSQQAARIMFKGLLENWGFDLHDEDLVDDYAPYREFLEGI